MNGAVGWGQWGRPPVGPMFPAGFRADSALCATVIPVR